MVDGFIIITVIYKNHVIIIISFANIYYKDIHLILKTFFFEVKWNNLTIAADCCIYYDRDSSALTVVLIIDIPIYILSHFKSQSLMCVYNVYSPV